MFSHMCQTLTYRMKFYFQDQKTPSGCFLSLSSMYASSGCNLEHVLTKFLFFKLAHSQRVVVNIESIVSKHENSQKAGGPLD